MSRKITQIEMNQPGSQRGIRSNLLQDSPEELLPQQIPDPDKNAKPIPQTQARPAQQNYLHQRIDESRNIFDVDFQVQQMIQPKKYLPNYNQNVVAQEDNCMTAIQTCCGNCLLYCSSIAPFCCMKCCVYELNTSSVGLVERFGRFSHLLMPGFNRINPLSDEVREVDMRIRLLSCPNNQVITQDNVKLTIDTSVAYRVTNPIIVFYKLGSQLNKAILQLVIASFRKIIGIHLLQNVLTDRLVVAREVIEEIRVNMTQGVFIQNVFIDQIHIPPDVSAGLSSVAKQKRISQASIINSKADVQCAALMRQSAQLLDTKAAMQIRYLELVQQLGKRGVSVLMDIGVNKHGYTQYSKTNKKTEQQMKQNVQKLPQKPIPAPTNQNTKQQQRQILNIMQEQHQPIQNRIQNQAQIKKQQKLIQQPRQQQLLNKQNTQQNLNI